MFSDFLDYILTLINSITSLEFIFVPVIVMGIFALVIRLLLRRYF